MVYKLSSKIIVLVFSLILLVLLLSLPKIVNGQEQYPDISGKWSSNAVLYFEQERCRSSPDQPTDQVSMSFSFTQNGENVIVSADDFFAPDKDDSFKNVFFNVGFVDPINMYGNAQYMSGIGKLNLTFLDFKLSDDCNTITGKMTFIYYEGSSASKTCTGNGNFIARRVVPTGCGFKCFENWTCSEWSECKNGTQTRLCEDKNYCKNESSRPAERQNCEMPAPVEPQGNIWTYIIIILLILIASAAFIIVRMKLKSKKERMLEDLRETIQVMNEAVNKGDDLGAMNWYRTFGEMFEKYKPYITEEDYNKLYEDVLKVYQRIVGMHRQ